MINRAVLRLLSVLLIVVPAAAQVGGNSSYSRSGARTNAETRVQAQRTVAKDDLPQSPTGTYVEASVLLNQPADAYVALFGIAAEGATAEACAAQCEGTVKALAAQFEPLGVAAADLAVDWVAQTKVYGYEQRGDVMQEKLTGFELKQNVAVPYGDPALLPRLTLAAARAGVHDLVKVDYVVRDLETIRDRLMDSAAAAIKAKLERYQRLFGLTFGPPAQVIAERSAVCYPAQMYDSYTAQETESVRQNFDRQRYTVHGARKSTTFYYNGLDADGFDTVINPIVTAPSVQFTLYLKLRYEALVPAAPQAPRTP